MSEGVAFFPFVVDGGSEVELHSDSLSLALAGCPGFVRPVYSRDLRVAVARSVNGLVAVAVRAPFESGWPADSPVVWCGCVGEPHATAVVGSPLLPSVIVHRQGTPYHCPMREIPGLQCGR